MGEEGLCGVDVCVCVSILDQMKEGFCGRQLLFPAPGVWGKGVWVLWVCVCILGREEVLLLAGDFEE